MKLSKFRSTFFIATLLLGGIAFASAIQPVAAQNVSPTPSPTVTPNPTITVLENRISTLEADVNLLIERKVIESQILQLQNEKQLLPIYIGGGILSMLGLSTVIGLWIAYKNFTKKTIKQLEEDTRKTLDDAFYNADPRNFPVYIPKRNFELEKQRLKKLGFKKMTEYEFLPEIGSKGIIIYSISGSDFKDESIKKKAVQEIKDIEGYIQENKNAPYAYVIYIKGQLKEAGDLVNEYDNVATANMPVTIAGHLYTLARGLMD
jgi:hypothetical protein